MFSGVHGASPEELLISITPLLWDKGYAAESLTSKCGVLYVLDESEVTVG